MSAPQNDVDVDETSGVTTLRPMPAKPARLSDLAEGESTQYFSASELLERGKALAAHSSEPAPPPVPPVTPAASVVEPAPQRPGWRAQFRQASLARKAIAILLPVLCLLLLAAPRFDKLRHPTPTKPSASVAVPPVPALAKVAKPLPNAAVLPIAAAPPSAAAPSSAAAITLPRGMTWAHAAADSLATGDFARAAALYRELSRREPANQAYREAARILSERTVTRSP